MWQQSEGPGEAGGFYCNPKTATRQQDPATAPSPAMLQMGARANPASQSRRAPLNSATPRCARSACE
eukprot:3470-Alexandrium_andersonii.AAC.1